MIDNQERFMNLIDPVIWTDDVATSRCNLPKSDPGSAIVPGCLALMSVFVGSLPFLLATFLYLLASAAERQRDGFLSFLIALILVWGVVYFPIALFFFGKSLLLLRGRTEIILDSSRLRVITKAGPFRSTRRCKLEELGGFRIEDPEGAGYGLPGGHSNLVAVRKDGRKIHLLRMCPNEIVGQLVSELPKKIARLARRAGLTSGDRIPTDNLQAEVISLDPMATRERKNKPIGSNLWIEERSGEIVIQLPRLGFWNSTSPGARFWIIGFLSIQLLFIPCLVFALLAGKVQGQPTAGWVIVFVCTAIAAGIVLNRLSAATRSGSVHIADEYLRFRERDFFVDHYAGWKWVSIEIIHVGVKKYESDEGVSWNHFVEVQPGPNEARYWYDNRTKGELEWIVTLIGNQIEHRNA